MYVAPAETEMMTRIRALDQEESFLRRRASQRVTDANSDLDQADRLAQTRRQYEFALQQLGVDPMPKSKKIPVKATPATARVVHVNAST